MTTRHLLALLTAAGLVAVGHGAPAQAQARPPRGGVLLASTHQLTYALHPGTGNLLGQLANGRDAVVSRQGRVAFSRDIDPCPPPAEPDGGCPSGPDLLTANLDGSAERAVVHVPDTAGPMSRPDWSPDGRRIVFSWGVRGERGLAIVDADGSALEHLVANAGPGTFSPDGSRVAYVLDNDVHVLDLASRRTRVVTTDGPATASPLDWSPDGRHIVFGGTGGFAIVPAAGGAAVGSDTAESLDNVLAPVFSPDGRRVAFTASVWTSDGTSMSRVYTANRDGSDLVAVADGGYELTDWLRG